MRTARKKPLPNPTTHPSHPEPRSGPQSVGRIIAILEAVSAIRSGATLSELARHTDAPKTSLVGLLQGLTDEGCLLRDQAGRYRLGPRLRSLALRAAAGEDLALLARPALANLVEATGETAVLGCLAPEGDMAVYLDRIESHNSIRYAVAVGERRELYCTAMGKVLLAHFPPVRLQAYLKATRRVKFTATTLISAAALSAEMGKIRRTGIAHSNEERVTGACAMASPIYTADGSVAGALLVAGPTHRMRAAAAKNERALRQAASTCTQLAGGVWPTGSLA